MNRKIALKKKVSEFRFFKLVKLKVKILSSLMLFVCDKAIVMILSFNN